MSRAKKTNRKKKESAIGLYRQVGELLNRGEKRIAQANCKHLDIKNYRCVSCGKRIYDPTQDTKSNIRGVK